jgi:hypothetical protein
MPGSTQRTTLGALGGGDLAAAAGVIADAARANAAAWSETIPAGIHVEVRGRTALIYTDAKAAYPNEVKGVRHPVFGPTERNPDPAWVANQYRPFLGPAADEMAGPAMARYARRVDAMCRRAGFF